jgi:ABC-type sugar transport system ATPase subunit
MRMISVSNDELRTVRQAMRDLNRMVEQLESGAQQKFVLAKQHQMRAVVISLDHFASLERAAGLSDQRRSA